MFTLGPYGGAPGRAGFFAVLASYYVIGLASAAYLSTKSRRSRVIAAAWNLVLGVYLMVREPRGSGLLADYGIFAAVYLAVTSMAAWNHVEDGVTTYEEP